MVQRHCLTGDQWELVADLVEAVPEATGRPPKDRRPILNGIFWILRTGAAWRDLPERFGKWQTVCDHFNHWSKDGTFDAILRRLQEAMVEAVLPRKSLFFDGKGHPLTAVLSPAQDHESRYLPAVLDSIQLSDGESGDPIVPAKLAGEKGYRYEWIDDWLLQRHIAPVIPSKKNEDRSVRAVEFDRAPFDAVVLSSN